MVEAGPFRLRPFELSDLPLIQEAATDPHIPLITNVPAAYTPEEGRAFIERQWGRAADGTGYSLAVADAASDRAAGQIGLWMRQAGERKGSASSPGQSGMADAW